MVKFYALAALVCVMPAWQNFNSITKKNTPQATLRLTAQLLTPPDYFGVNKKPVEQEAATPNFTAQAQQYIRTSEYNFTWVKDVKAYVTPNRKNNLRFCYTDNGFSVSPRTTKIAINPEEELHNHKEVKYTTIPNWKIAFNLNKKQFKSGVFKTENNTATYTCGNITVQYINNDDGMRQNFIVQSPSSNNTLEKISFSINTKLKKKLSNNALQFYHKQKNVLSYSQLKVWDADGKILPAFFKKQKNNNYCIQVNTSGAIYPITIDPLSATPNTSIDPTNQASANFGFSVASAGDVNGDGYSDVIIGTPNYDDGGADKGRAYTFHGSATGISATPVTTLTGITSGDKFGFSVSSAGNVNNDNYSDVIIGVPGFDEPGRLNEGRAFVYHGSATGLSAVASTTIENANQTGASLGTSVALAGSVNNDDFSDVIVGAPGFDDGGNGDEGIAFVYQSNGTAINTAPSTILNIANQGGANFGVSLASAGDVNGDGFSDVIVGANNFDDGISSNEGRAFVFHGAAAGLSASVSSTLDGANQAGANFGFSVASAGDVNGDGYSDVIVGADFFDGGLNNEGQAFIYQGTATGLGVSPTPSNTPDDADQLSAFFGFSVACAGDINGDGYSDVAIGAPVFDNTGGSNAGRVFFYFGSSSGLGTTFTSFVTGPNQVDAEFGTSVAPAGDVNGDGYSDVIIGAFKFDGTGFADEGGAYVFHGSPDGLSPTPNNTPSNADQVDAQFGYSVASAGDVNGDGFSDVIIGARLFDNGAPPLNEGRVFIYHGAATGLPLTPTTTRNGDNQYFSYFGESVASAGDVNADGYSDIIIGAPLYDDGASIDEGAAYVYLGSPSGLGVTYANKLVDCNQGGAVFGTSVSSAGDVNKDGYSDVIIGAPKYDASGNTDAGGAFVYYGSSTGLPNTANIILASALVAQASFGISVANTGDVNGDGFGDVIVGASRFTDGGNADEGRAFVYHGSATGLPLVPNRQLDGANQPNSEFGNSVASAGDVNGDGFADVVVGAYRFDNGANNNEGRAFVYYGSTSGLPATPNVFMGTNLGFTAFGVSVASAGDVNGDGYSDVIVGSTFFNDAPNNLEGRVFVYYGSPTGISNTANDFCDDANQTDAYLGNSVSGAGDINADGYSDVIIGAVGFNDAPNNDEGRAFLYNGNVATANKRNNLRMYNEDLITPINSTNYISNQFGAGLFAKSFIGNVKAKIIWETRINYDAYSTSGSGSITNSPFFTAQAATYTQLTPLGTELKSLITKEGGGGSYTKLRARVKYHPATAITGQLFGPWRYVSDIIDGNKLGALPVELISFTALWQQKGQVAKINFITDKESGVKNYTIQKSSDATNFNDIAVLPAQNASGRQNYNYVDNNATNALQYYRLKIIGLNSVVEYSNVVLLKENIAAQVLVFPNPTTDKLQIVLNENYATVNMQIVNTTGQIVQKLQNVSAINQTINLPVQKLDAGIYLLHIQIGNKKQVVQFVKQ
jgi:hypothetical protein